jgi:uncharacterized protein (DUF4415 family)
MNEKPTKKEDALHEMRPHYDFSNAAQGALVPAAANKTRITIRIDSDVLAWFRQRVHEQGGGSYQRLINEALREYVEREMEGDLETRLRTILREELQAAHIG